MYSNFYSLMSARVFIPPNSEINRILKLNAKMYCVTTT